SRSIVPPTTPRVPYTTLCRSVADPRADEGEPAGGDDDPFGDEAVEPVDEVHRIDGADPDDGEGEHMGDSLSREHRDGRTEQQSQDELADQSSDGSQRVEVIAHPDRRIAPSEHQESDGQDDAAESEGSVF